jgi:hypothetical protein
VSRMSWAPIDSTEAREELERDRDQAAAAARSDLEHMARCRDGWLGEDNDGRPVPCLHCRPHLAQPARCSTCQAPAGACAAQVHARRGHCCDLCEHPVRSLALVGAR